MSRRRGDRAEVTTLPGAACRVCGYHVREGEGQVLPSVQAAAHFDVFGRPMKGEPWLRMHDRCAGLSVAEILIKMTGIKASVTDREARLALERADVRMPTAVARDLGPRDLPERPWGFVSPEERKRLREALEAVRGRRQGDGPHRHKSGGCGFCGRSRSVTWWSGTDALHRTPLAAFRDGTAAAICDDCIATWREAGSPRDLNQVRARFAYLASGMRPQLNRQEIAMSMKFYAEVADDEHRGTDRPWSYSAAIARLRNLMQEGQPFAVVDEFDRQHAQKMAAVRRARALKEMAEAERASQPGADLVW